MNRFDKIRSIFVAPFLALLCSLAPLHAAGALTYHFESVTTGTYPRNSRGTVTIDGSQWRIDFDAGPDVTDLTSIVHDQSGELKALNATNRTWFRLPSRKRLGIDASLFTFGKDARVPKLEVKALPSEASEPNAGDSVTRIVFSYRIETRVEAERVRGKVWGEIRIQTRPSDADLALPWQPFELTTGSSDVDKALSDAVASIDGSVSQAEVEVARRLENGAILQQVVRRTVSDFARSSAAGSFSVPSDYVYQEPIIGVPRTGAKP